MYTHTIHIMHAYGSVGAGQNAVYAQWATPVRTGASSANQVDHARVAVATTASSAKEKCLPVLQANQDVFSAWFSFMHDIHCNFAFPGKSSGIQLIYILHECEASWRPTSR